MASQMAAYVNLIAKLRTLRSDLTDRIIVDNITIIAYEQKETTIEVLERCIKLAKSKIIMPWEVIYKK